MPCRHRWQPLIDYEFMAEARVCLKGGCGRLAYRYGPTSGPHAEGEPHWLPAGHRLNRVEIAAMLLENERRA